MDLSRFFDLSTSQPLDSALLDQFEKRLGRRLPEAYKTFLQTVHKSRCLPHEVCAYHRNGTCTSFEVRGFYSLHAQPDPRRFAESFFSTHLFDSTPHPSTTGMLPIGYTVGPEQLWLVLERTPDEDHLGRARAGTLFMDTYGYGPGENFEGLVAPSLAPYFDNARVLDENDMSFATYAEAVLEQQSEAAILNLLSAGYSLNQIFKNGNTIADSAAFGRHYALLELLFTFGARSPRLNYYGTMANPKRRPFDAGRLSSLLAMQGRKGSSQ